MHPDSEDALVDTSLLGDGSATSVLAQGIFYACSVQYFVTQCVQS